MITFNYDYLFLHLFLIYIFYMKVNNTNTITIYKFCYSNSLNGKLKIVNRFKTLSPENELLLIIITICTGRIMRYQVMAYYTISVRY